MGAGGVSGAALTVTDVGAETHPEAFLTVMLYVPGVTPVNRPDVLLYITPSRL